MIKSKVSKPQEFAYAIAFEMLSSTSMVVASSLDGIVEEINKTLLKTQEPSPRQLCWATYEIIDFILFFYERVCRRILPRSESDELTAALIYSAKDCAGIQKPKRLKFFNEVFDQMSMKLELEEGEAVMGVQLYLSCFLSAARGEEVEIPDSARFEEFDATICRERMDMYARLSEASESDADHELEVPFLELSRYFRRAICGHSELLENLVGDYWVDLSHTHVLSTLESVDFTNRLGDLALRFPAPRKWLP